MARSLNKLTAVGIKRPLAPARHSDGGGLYLNVTKSGTKSWVYMWSSGKRREMGLGPYPALSLAEARKKAEDCRKLVAQGKNPIAERDRLSEKTFGECALAYIEIKRSGWRSKKHINQWSSTLTTYCKSIWQRPVSSIDLSDAQLILQPIWISKNETASRVRGRIESVLDYAKTKGWRQGENPARWKGNLANILPPRQKLQRGKMAAMPYADVPAFFQKLQSSDTMSARALEFLILTAARSGEVRLATWEEIDIENKVWTISANRMKAGVEHRVPLSGKAIEILTPLMEARISEFLFPGQRLNRPMSDMTLTALIRRWKIDNVTVHGFRSSFRDWCGEETDYDRESVELALAHKFGSAVEQAYRRRDSLEKRRVIMGTWEKHCLSKSAL